MEFQFTQAPLTSHIEVCFSLLQDVDDVQLRALLSMLKLDSMLDP